MAYTQESIPDLSGRTAVVTGANGGLGLATAAALAGAGAHVVMAARNQEKAASAVADLLEADPEASVEVVELDLASLASIRTAAGKITARHEVLDILVNNAGLMALPERKTADGFEMQFGVNHLGHWALTAHLMTNLLRSPGGRVVTVTSVARHLSNGVKPANPHLEGAYGAWKAYNQSKLANYHFALGLQDEFEAARASATSLVAHPGLTNSDLQSHTQDQGAAGFVGSFSERWAGLSGMNTERGAMPLVRAATDPNGAGGTLYAPRFMTNGAAVKRPILRPGRRQAIDNLWAISERETGVALNVAQATKAASI